MSLNTSVFIVYGEVPGSCPLTPWLGVRVEQAAGGAPALYESADGSKIARKNGMMNTIVDNNLKCAQTLCLIAS